MCVAPDRGGLAIFELFEGFAVLVFPGGEPIGAAPMDYGGGRTRAREFNVLDENADAILLDEGPILDQSSAKSDGVRVLACSRWTYG